MNLEQQFGIQDDCVIICIVGQTLPSKMIYRRNLVTGLKEKYASNSTDKD